MRSLLQDVRFGLRLFGRQPGFTLVAVLVLALGISATTTMFSLVNGLMLRPRLGAGESLISVYSKHRTEPDTFRGFSYPDFADLRARQDIFASLTAHLPAMAGISEGDQTRRTFIDITSRDLFDTFNVPLAMGRAFSDLEERPRADIPVAILSHRAWVRMGSPDDVLSRTVRLNQRDYAVIGVAAEGFTGPIAMVTPELWVPLGMYHEVANDFADDRSTGTLADRTNHQLILFGRLRDDVSVDRLPALLDAHAAAMSQTYPEVSRDYTLTTGGLSRFSVSTQPVDDTAVSLVGFSLVAMAGLVLMVASLNLANMQLARAASRRKELAIRLSIGGGRWRVARQVLVEGLLLSLAGGAIAMVISWAAMRAVLSSVAGLLPIEVALSPAPDARVFLATFAFALVGTLISGLGPALLAARTDVLPALKEQAGELPVDRRRRFATRHLLVMGQLALSLALLTTAGAFVRAALVAADVDPGFSLDRGIHAGIDVSLAGMSRAQGTEVYGRVVERMRETPGVTGAAVASLIPFGDVLQRTTVQRPGGVIRPSDPEAVTGLTSAVAVGVSEGYFPALGLNLLAGRDFTASEVRSAEAPAVGIVDQALATRLFGDDNPIGRQLQVNRGLTEAPELVTIVGLAPPIRQDMAEAAPSPHLYRPYPQNYRSGAILHVRTQAGVDEASFLPTVRRLLRDVEPRLPVVSLETGPMYRERNPMLWIIRTGAVAFGAFGLIALFMAALGIYGVKAYLVSRRTREIGVRMALGATARQVTGLVMRDGLGLTITGLVLGLGLSFLTVRAVGSMIFGGGGFDLPIVGAAFVTLGAAALLANLIPARRATRVAPTVALRE